METSATESVCLDRYELVERIGRGAAGMIYRARDRSGGVVREVCVKRLVTAVDEDARGLREEARLLARVRHANVVSLLGVGEEACGAPFLVLELVRGSDLRALSGAASNAPPDRRLATPGLLPDAVAVHIACAILRALAAVQRALPGLVHRDVTPHNVLVSNEGEVKLADFGIALAVDRARWTHPRVIKGKVGYVSPEHVRGEELDLRSDLFSVGVILYELLTRRRPWGVARGIAELYAIRRGRMDPMSVHRDADPALARVVETLLAPRRRDRPATADDALRALAPFSAGDLGSLRLAALVAQLALPRDEGDS